MDRMRSLELKKKHKGLLIDTKYVIGLAHAGRGVGRGNCVGDISEEEVAT